MSGLSTGHYQGTVVNNQHNKGRTWIDTGIFWDYIITFKGLMPMKGSVKARTKQEAENFLRARHAASEDSIVEQITVYGKSNKGGK